MNIEPRKLMAFGSKGRLREAYAHDAFNLLAYIWQSDFSITCGIFLNPGCCA